MLNISNVKLPENIAVSKEKPEIKAQKNIEPLFGWQKEKKGKAIGFHEHNKHFINFNAAKTDETKATSFNSATKHVIEPPLKEELEKERKGVSIIA